MTAEPRSQQDKPQGAAASLFNGLSVLRAFSIDKPVLGVTEIAQRVNLHKSTVSRILAGLREAGYVERDPDSGRFRLGLELIAMAGPLLAELDVRRIAAPTLARLTELTEETSALTVWNGREAVAVDQVPSPRNVKHTAPIGTRYPKYESSTVRAFLAELPAAEVELLISQGLVTHDAESGLSNDYAAHLVEVRSAGYAINDGNTTPEEVGIAAPVHDYRGSVVGCIMVSAPRSRTAGQRIDDIARHVVAAAAEVSARLGNSAEARGR